MYYINNYLTGYKSIDQSDIKRYMYFKGQNYSYIEWQFVTNQVIHYYFGMLQFF